jgi:hypothetical protein
MTYSYSKAKEIMDSITENDAVTDEQKKLLEDLGITPRQVGGESFTGNEFDPMATVRLLDRRINAAYADFIDMPEIVPEFSWHTVVWS